MKVANALICFLILYSSMFFVSTIKTRTIKLTNKLMGSIDVIFRCPFESLLPNGIPRDEMGLRITLEKGKSISLLNPGYVYKEWEGRFHAGMHKGFSAIEVVAQVNGLYLRTIIETDSENVTEQGPNPDLSFKITYDKKVKALNVK